MLSFILILWNKDMQSMDLKFSCKDVVRIEATWSGIVSFRILELVAKIWSRTMASKRSTLGKMADEDHIKAAVQQLSFMLTSYMKSVLEMYSQ
jgi:hypothetical protein